MKQTTCSKMPVQSWMMQLNRPVLLRSDCTCSGNIVSRKRVVRSILNVAKASFSSRLSSERQLSCRISKLLYYKIFFNLWKGKNSTHTHVRALISLQQYHYVTHQCPPLLTPPSLLVCFLATSNYGAHIICRTCRISSSKDDPHAANGNNIFHLSKL